LHFAHIKKSDDLDNACAKSLVLEALLAQAVAMQIISTLWLTGPALNQTLQAIKAHVPAPVQPVVVLPRC
jgi:hypothetical protein